MTNTEIRKIPDGWMMTTLGAVADVNPSTPLKQGALAKYVAMERLDPFTRRIYSFEEKAFKGGAKFKNGDTLLARITPCLENGKTAYVDILDNNEIGFGSTEYIVIREKKNLSNRKFLYYFAISPRFRNAAIQSMTGTSGRQRVQTELVVNKQFIIPPLPEQRAIAAVLSSFDDKIELLREQNKTLEATAQAIFKEWFVNFNFPDKNGKPYKDAGGRMDDSDLGEIPAGWKVGRLRDMCQIHDSKRVPLSASERLARKGKYPYHGATQIMDYIDEYLFEGIYLLLAEDGSVMDIQGFPVLQYVTGKFWINNHAHVLRGKDKYSTEYLYLFFKRTKVAGIVTGAVQLKINQENLLGLETVKPKEEILDSFNFAIWPLFQKIIANNSQIQALSTLRDTILPKIMRGEVRVKGFDYAHK